jgi:predicted thioesterase
MIVRAGDSATLTFTVAEADSAIALGSGDVEVLGTPRLIAWCEAATVAAVESSVVGGQTTVGFKVRVNHLAPTALGATVEVRAEVESIDGRQVSFAVSAADGNGPVASGTITRVVVDRSAFMARLEG